MPEEPISRFEAAEFGVRKILLDRFLEKDYINLMLAEVVLEQGTAPLAPEPSDIPNEALHWETIAKARARRVRGLEPTMGCCFFLYTRGFFLGADAGSGTGSVAPFSSNTGPSCVEAALLS
jgi:hypothetical protein